MIDLTNLLRGEGFNKHWFRVIAWLEENVGVVTLQRLGITQGKGWMIQRRMHDGDMHYISYLYIDDTDLELMFRLACL